LDNDRQEHHQHHRHRQHGTDLATRALTGEYSVQLLGKTKQAAGTVAGELDADRTTAAASGDDLTGDLVVLAVWYPVTKEVVSQYGDALAGKVVIDISNPVNVGSSRTTRTSRSTRGRSGRSSSARAPRLRASFMPTGT
jgi:predicted dinucleotide-binding enzyme